MTGKTRPGGHVGGKFISQFKVLVLFIFCTVVLDCGIHVFVTGHKSETSLKTYTGYTTEKTKQMMSDTISEAVGRKSKSSLKETTTYHGFNLTNSIRHHLFGFFSCISSVCF
jgi:hypothetical protein